MDSSTFRIIFTFKSHFLDLRYAPDQKLNIRLIENTDIKNILRVLNFEYFNYSTREMSVIYLLL